MDAEYAENKGRFIPDIINGMWAIMDEASWVVPAHNVAWFRPHNSDARPMYGESGELPDFDQPVIIALFSAGTAGMLSHAYYLFKEQIDAVTPLVLRRLEKVLEERIFEPFMKYNYWWTGLGRFNPPNNWNPWVLSNVLACYAYVCKDEDKRAAAVARACLMLEKFVAGYNDDGGCDEGPSYWGVAGASFFDCLEELSDMMGSAFDACLQDPKVQNIGRYIYRAHIAGRYFTNYADAPKLIHVSCDLVYRFGKKIGDDNMVRLAVALRDLYKEDSKMEAMDVHRFYRHVKEILNAANLENEPNRGFPLVEDVYLDGLEQMMAREKDGSTDGLYLAAKGGHNGEGHSHNDIGSFVLYSDGEPVIIDLGSGQYSAKTFGPERFTIPQMQSAYHNLPVINGVQEVSGRDHAASDAKYTCENGVSTLSMNILTAYGEGTGAEKWQRTFVFDRNEKKVTLTDEAVFTGENNSCETMFMVPVAPVVEGNAVTIAVPDARPVILTGEGVNFTAEEVDLTYDPMLTHFWNGKVWRVKVAAHCGKEHKQIFTVVQG